MLDTGSSAVFLSAPFARKLRIATEPTDALVEVANTHFSHADATAGAIEVIMEGVATRTQAYVLPALVGGVDIILGESWLMPNHI